MIADCRAVVLAAQGKAFCAGANFGDGATLDKEGQRPGELNREKAVQHLYLEGNRLFRTKKPIVAAVHGAAVGGGLGLAMVADFRVACPETRFCANFTRLGFHPGFGLTVTLPLVIGATKAALMFYTSRRVRGDEAYAMGLADVLVPQDQVRAAAMKLAAEIAENAPLGLISTRATMRADLADRVRAGDRARAQGANLRCARPTTSRKASRPRPNGGCRISPAADCSDVSPAWPLAEYPANYSLAVWVA